MPVMCPGTADTTTGAGFSTAERGAPPAASPGNRGLVCLWNPSIVSTSGILAPLPRRGRAPRDPTSLHLRRGRVLPARAESVRDLRNAGSAARRPTRARNGARRRAFPLGRSERGGARSTTRRQLRSNKTPSLGKRGAALRHVSAPCLPSLSSRRAAGGSPPRSCDTAPCTGAPRVGAVSSSRRRAVVFHAFSRISAKLTLAIPRPRAHPPDPTQRRPRGVR